MMRKSKQVAGIAVALVAGCGAVAPSHAELLAYDGFDYVAGTQLEGQAGGTGWDPLDVWDANNALRLIIENGGLSYLNLQVTGNAVGNPTTSGANAVRTFANAPTTGSVFFSFLINGDETSTGRYGVLLRPEDDTTGPGVIGQQSTQKFDGAGTFTFRPNQSTEGGLNGAFAGGTSINGTNLLVVQYNYDTNQAAYWANPTALGGTAPTATQSGINFTDPTKTIEEFFFSQREATSLNTIFDEFRVGTTYASVTPIPEPASLALLALGGLAMMPRRARR